MRKIYQGDFYSNRHRETFYAADVILSIVSETIPRIDSAVDFGCGVGTWLSVLRERGTREILGVDGPWVEKNLLKIPPRYFLQVDMGGDEIQLDRRYDLAISLEIAEHLPPEVAKSFVKSLTNASDFILFSAAIPFQGGTNHINEQWPGYWGALFNENGYAAMDFIRREIWNNEKIPAWYRQNALMFVKQERINELNMRGTGIDNPHSPMALVHPEIYLSKVDRISSVKGSWQLLRHAVIKLVKRKLGKSG
jgi:SAM-dependent methyltransferase